MIAMISFMQVSRCVSRPRPCPVPTKGTPESENSVAPLPAHDIGITLEN
jgi:hypothetical protein